MSVAAPERRAMIRALELAATGPRGRNPQVGAVILSPAGDVLAEGRHLGAGTAHAEVDALSRLAPGAARGATAVVTLEPCNHTGRTGPCAQALIDAGIARVVYGLDDPNPRAAGGAAHLRAAGVSVTGGVLADRVRTLIDGWILLQRLGRPQVTVKWAQSLDGRVAAADGTSRWITGAQARADVHRRREHADAIVAGIGTVLADDPALTARRPDGTLTDHQPLPVVLGRRPIPESAAVLRHPHTPVVFDGRDLPAALTALVERGIQRVFVEGGPTLASAFVRAGLVDELVAYLAPMLIGGRHLALNEIGVGTLADAPRLAVASLDRLGEDIRIVAHPAVPSVQEGL